MNHNNKRTRLRFLVFVLLLSIIQGATSLVSTATRLKVDERAFTASKIYSLLQIYFDPPKAGSDPSLDVSYNDYLRTVLAVDDRRQFDLATMEFVAQLHNGHTFFWDTWLDKNNQQSLGFYAAPLDGYWVVQTSFLASLKPGDVIVRIDNTPAEAFFQQQQRYIAASNSAAQRHNLFLLPYLFPEQFTVLLYAHTSVVFGTVLICQTGGLLRGRANLLTTGRKD